MRTRPVRPGPRRRVVATTGLLASGALLALASAGADAQELDCSIAGDRRHVRLELPGRDHLCEVSVTYGGSGERRVVWYAENDTVFCSERLEDLIGKYESEWGFECDRWPDASGVSGLDRITRTRLDDELRATLDGLARGDADARITGVRVVARDPGASAAPAPDARAYAVQFFVREGDGASRTELRLLEDSAARLVSDDLAANLSTGAERIDSAWVESWQADGGLVVATAVRPPRSASAPDEPCRGNQTLRPAADGTLVPGTPHRYACGTDPDVR